MEFTFTFLSNVFIPVVSHVLEEIWQTKARNLHFQKWFSMIDDILVRHQVSSIYFSVSLLVKILLSDVPTHVFQNPLSCFKRFNYFFGHSFLFNMSIDIFKCSLSKLNFEILTRYKNMLSLLCIVLPKMFLGVI